MATKADVILSSMGVKLGEEMTTEEISAIFRNFKEAKKIIEDYEKNTLKPFLFRAAEELGDTTDAGGNRVLLEDGFGWEKQARVSVSVDGEKALDLMMKKNLSEYIDRDVRIREESMDEVIALLSAIGRDELLINHESVSPENIEQAYIGGDITDDELGSIITRKTTYALVEIKPQKKQKHPFVS